jgi:hypothetical protein
VEEVVTNQARAVKHPAVAVVTSLNRAAMRKMFIVARVVVRQEKTVRLMVTKKMDTGRIRWKRKIQKVKVMLMIPMSLMMGRRCLFLVDGITAFRLQ